MVSFNPSRSLCVLRDRVLVSRTKHYGPALPSTSKGDIASAMSWDHRNKLRRGFPVSRCRQSDECCDHCPFLPRLMHIARLRSSILRSIWHSSSSESAKRVGQRWLPISGVFYHLENQSHPRICQRLDRPTNTPRKRWRRKIDPPDHRPQQTVQQRMQQTYNLPPSPSEKALIMASRCYTMVAQMRPLI